MLPDAAHLSVIDEDGSLLFNGHDGIKMHTTELLRPPSTEADVVLEDSSECEAEALKSVSAAEAGRGRKNGPERALKLFRHAVALCPKHPKVKQLGLS